MIFTNKVVGAGGLTSFWETKTDSEILKTNFRNDDPEALPQLLAELPKGQEVPELEFEYDTRQSAVGMVRCRHCKKNAANHNIGFVLRYQDGSRILVGKNCGEKQYGQAFTYRANHFRAAIKRSELLRRKLGLMAVRKELVAALDEIKAYEGWMIYRDSKRSFWQGMHHILDLINTAVLKRDGVLTVESTFRDTEAEALVWTRTRKVSAPIYRTISTNIGVLAGREFFRGGESPERIIPALTQRMINAAFSIDEKDRNYDLEVLFRAMEGIVTEMREQAHRIGVMKEALSEANMITLGRWLKAEQQGNYRVKDGKFYRHDGAGNVVFHRHAVYGTANRQNPVECDLPPPFAPAPDALIEQVANLIRYTVDSSDIDGNKSGT